MNSNDSSLINRDYAILKCYLIDIFDSICIDLDNGIRLSFTCRDLKHQANVNDWLNTDPHAD